MREAFVSKPDEGEPSRCACRCSCRASPSALMLGVFYVGLYPQQLFDAIDHATSVLFV